MQIISITNKNTNNKVCPQYLHKELDMSKSIMLIGKPLMIVYKTGSHFGHENVINIERLQNEIIRIETTNKIWMIY